MQTTANPLPGVSSAGSLEQLSDGELLASTRRLVGRSNQLLAELLAHLAEVEARGIHRTRACSSLYAYCQYELRFSEDEAFRRVAAARLVRRFPALLGALASGELHLTGLLLLGPHLTEDNLAEVLARAKHRSKREILRLVRVLDPLPAVPARIEPLGPAPARLVPAEPSWEQFVQAMCPVRELAPGERPRDWMGGAEESDARGERRRDSREGVEESDANSSAEGELVAGMSGTLEAVPVTPEQADVKGSRAVGASAPGGLAPERYKVQFTATEEYVRLVQQAKALLSHANPRVTLEELQLRAMRAFVAELSKKKFAAKGRKPAASHARRADVQNGEVLEVERPTRATVKNGVALEETERPARAKEQKAQRSKQSEPQHDEQAPERSPRRRGRHIPAAVRRAVFERDSCRCTYVAATGERCVEAHFLEFHHLHTFAGGGEHDVSNLTLRCAAHNALAAEEDFGRGFMASKIRDASMKRPAE